MKPKIFPLGLFIVDKIPIRLLLKLAFLEKIKDF
jgi:hypothetical protein